MFILMKHLSFFITCLLMLSVAAADFEIKATKPGAVYAAGETIELTIRSLVPQPSAPLTIAILEDEVFKTNVVVAATNTAHITWPTVPGRCTWIKCCAHQGNAHQMFGAVAGLLEARQSLPKPADFEEYWSAVRSRVLATPANTLLAPNPQAVQKTGHYIFSAAGAEGFAGPTGYLHLPQNKSLKYPIFIFVHGAGVHIPPKGDNWESPLPEHARMTGIGRNGVIFLNLNAHGYEYNHSNDYYEQLNTGALKFYPFINNGSRDKWYMKGLAVRLIRAIDELCKLPEWDGKNIIVSGGSQGGAQALMAGGLDKRVNWIYADVPAMCDFAGELTGHAAGWPKPVCLEKGRYFLSTQYNDQIKTGRETTAAAMQEVAYLDCVNFATCINPTAHLFVRTGGGDGVCPPTGVFAAYLNAPTPFKTLWFSPLGCHCHGEYNARRDIAPVVFNDRTQSPELPYAASVRTRVHEKRDAACLH